MSSTNRGATRIDQDAYYTPASAIDPMIALLDLSSVTSFVEPCLGGGAIYDRVDVPRKGWCEIAKGRDYLESPVSRADVILTNPPFSLALEFLQKSLAEAKTVGYLLRLNFLGSRKRRDFWNANKPTHCFVLSERPVFAWYCQDRKVCKAAYRPGETTVCTECGLPVRSQTDSIEYAWFVWDRLGIVKAEKGIHVL
jgi:hypothetical protein